MLSFLDFVRHDLAFYSISRQMKDRRLYVTEQRKAAAEAAAIEDKKDKPSPDAASGQAQTAQTSHLPHAGVDTIDGGELVGKRRKGVRPRLPPHSRQPRISLPLNAACATATRAPILGRIRFDPFR